MPTLNVYIDADALARLQHAHRQTGRPIVELASAAIEDAAIRANPEITAKRRCPCCADFGAS